MQWNARKMLQYWLRGGGSTDAETSKTSKEHGSVDTRRYRTTGGTPTEWRQYSMVFGWSNTGKKESIYSSVFSRIFSVFPRFSLYWDSKENIQENIGAKKSVSELFFPYARGERQRIAKETRQFEFESKQDKSDGNSQRIHRLKSRNNPLLLANRGNTILDEF